MPGKVVDYPTRCNSKYLCCESSEHRSSVWTNRPVKRFSRGSFNELLQNITTHRGFVGLMQFRIPFLFPFTFIDKNVVSRRHVSSFFFFSRIFTLRLRTRCSTLSVEVVGAVCSLKGLPAKLTLARTLSIISYQGS